MGITFGMRAAILLAAFLLIAVSTPAPAQVDFLFPHGFASGDVTATSAMLWTRRDSPLEIAVEVSPDPQFGTRTFTAAGLPAVERGRVVTFQATGLQPATRYYYRFLVGGIVYSEVGAFTTAPAEDAPADLRLVFSGDADGTPVNGAPAYPFAIFDRMAAERADLFLFIGDTIYADSPFMPHSARTLAEYRAKYLESRSVPALQRLLRASPVTAIWDDHEVQNDFDSETVDPLRFEAARGAFVEAWPLSPQPGGRLYRSLRWGRDVEMFILDLRSYRSRQVSKTPACANPPGGRNPDLAPTLPARLRSAFATAVRALSRPVPPGCLEALRDFRRTLLGAEQKTWLLEGLRRSTATWKFVVSTVPVQEFFALPYDRWEGYSAEREEILSFVRTHRIANVVWLSADMHAVLINEVWVRTFEQPESTGMTEVVAGPLATAPFTRVEAVLGPLALRAFAAFVQAQPPQGLGASCAVFDRFTYALVEVSSRARTVTITPKDAAGVPVCPSALVLTARP